jgi:peptidoglycan/LPS O-acetylase OafA/YrhL
MKYRAEIDGLRALAVIPVILFHAGFELFSGGFVGVDVFFVISGYLITTILIEDIESKRFSIVNFYERRARRILPALFFVMLVCIPFAWMWMLPSQMKDFSQSLVAVSLFASNILFWRESGYFEAAAEEKPLLHTWSLAVEEQYYVLFPILLILAWRFGRNRVFWMIVVMAAISLLLSEWGWRNKETANFYLAPTRAWELFSGSIAAFIVHKKGVQKHNFLALLGLGAIIFSIFVYDEATPFPSVYALVPVLGVVLLVLYADKETIAAKVLSTKAFVGIGLISYSAYLWHQPLFAFARVASVDTFPSYVYLILSLLSIILAYISWTFIEIPFRNRSLNRRTIFLLTSVCVLLFSTIGFLGHINDGFISRFTQNQLELVSPKVGDTSGCHNGLEAATIRNGGRCIVAGGSDTIVDIAVIGDSHASALTDAVKIELASVGRGFLAFNGSWCVPLINFATNQPGKDGCIEEINAAYAQILEDEKIRTVVLHAEWANYDAGFRWNDTGIAGYVFSENGNFDYTKSSVGGNLQEFRSAVEYTFKKLYEANKNVIVVLSVPEFELHVPNSLNPKAPFAIHGTEEPTLPLVNFNKRTSQVSEVLVGKSSKFGFQILNPSLTFCDESRCFSHNVNGSFYTDGNHLSLLGASQLSPLLVETITEFGNE